MTLRYLTEARKRRTTQDALCRAILDDFEKEERVYFAYTTYRIVNKGTMQSRSWVLMAFAQVDI